jgi:hypothetical protein
MRVTPPIPITPAKLTSSSADATLAATAYNAGTTYAIGALVSVAADYRQYESLASSNTGNTPSTSPLWWKAIGYTETAYNAGTTYALGATASYNYRVYKSLQASNTGNTPPVLPETETAWWIDVGPMNRWAMFDLDSNTQTVWTSPMTVVFVPGERINTIGFNGLRGTTLTISATSVTAGGTIYGPVEVDLTYRDVFDGYEYCFNPFLTRPYHVVHDVPSYTDTVVTVTIEATTGNVKIGSCIVGNYIDLGETKADSTNRGISFSKVTRDLYGKATMVKRKSIPATKHRALIDRIKVDRSMYARDALLDAAPALYTGMDDAEDNLFGMHQIVGFYTRWEYSVDQGLADKVWLDLELEAI